MYHTATDPRLPSWACVGERRLEHIRRVSDLVETWADVMRIDPGERLRWLRAVWLHDALRDADPSVLINEGGDGAGVLLPEVLHGPAAAHRAEREGERDRGILDAVRYHSVGYPDWELVGRVLYAADFLEPGRSFDRAERAALAERFPADPDGVFREVVRRRLAYIVREGWSIPEPTVRLWNHLTASA